MKACKQCLIEKDVSEFRKHAFNKDGLTGKCKNCLHKDRQLRESSRLVFIPTTKTCIRCNLDLPSDKFLKNKSCKDGLNGWCKRCTKDVRLLNNYSISMDEYESMLLRQKGVCAICDTPDPKGPTSKFVVDHCHDTGKIRGLLCNHCNTGLGKLGDSVESLRKVIRYLESC
jgi:hypothetical protein